MKFHQLPVGARFRLGEAVYRKVSPLKAASEADASQRLVARSADVVRLLEEEFGQAQNLPSRIAGDRVETAIWALADACKQAMSGLDPRPDAAQIERFSQAVDAAAHDMLAQLAKPG